MHKTTKIATCHRTPADRGVTWCALLLICLCASGCSVLAQTHHLLFLAKRTTELEPRDFRYIKNEKLTRKRDVKLAKRVWAEVAGASEVHSFSRDYRRGFIAGFADFMYRGGTGEPPLVPPRDYWNLSYQSAGGKQAILDWFEGFRHGVDECRARGYRDMVVVPSSLLESCVTLDSGIERQIESVEPQRVNPSPAESLPKPAEGVPIPGEALPRLAPDAAIASPPDGISHPWDLFRLNRVDGEKPAVDAVNTAFLQPTSANQQWWPWTQSSAEATEMTRLPETDAGWRF